MKLARILQNVSSPQSWCELPWGEYYRAALEQRLQIWWPKIFGFHLIKIGNLSGEIATNECAISHQVNIAEQGCNVHLVASPYQLPFFDKSIDACLLAHTLCYSQDPHRVLHEADRILMADGWLIISVFNPISLLGISKLLPNICHHQLYIGRMFTQTRLLDWLCLLNYEVMQQSCFHVLPWNCNGGKFISTHLPALGCITLIVARKRTVPLTPISLKFGKRKPSLKPAVSATKNYRNGDL